ncbi:DEAD/DEAH box RNA helicase [Penicillium bovifimosum]|uniref:RNA helicase n=1 Tax=Penicillium bovifimosum TaxID=126998 RepID=A0A9W9GM41_9EURO|nr:DEAD/DEAH box RNA helicase [Penicillium bovifimosum]KAJ5124158.1 DEAD/DEAH box RNA helicase [Penicillium bovifimosum]
MDLPETHIVSAAETSSIVDDAASAVEGLDTQEHEPTQGVLSGVGPDTDTLIEVARNKGWTERVPYAYADLSNNKDHRDWASVATRYEWNDDYGEIGPAVPELEKQLFGSDHVGRAGDKIDELNSYKVNIESPNEIVAVTEWENLGLHPVMLQNIRLCGYAAPTAVQSYAIPAVLTNHDLIAVAQTGSGKTGAFLIPILSKLMGKAKKLAAPRPNVAELFNPREDAVRAEPLVLIVCPTRELATQIFDDARRLCYRSMLRPCVAYGGAPARLQREELQKGCDILIATPGRLLDFMAQTHVLSLRRVRYTVIDEADEMLDADWEDEFKKIMSGGDINEDEDHRYLMFSATFNKMFRKLAKTYLSDDHVRLRVGRAGSSHHNVVQTFIWVEQRQKMRALYDLLISMPPVRTLIFVNSRDQVDFVDDYLYNSGMPSTSIHSGRTQREREDAMRAFRSAKCPIMVATGVSARGLDVINVLHVVNYDLPSAVHGGITEYIHRIGRTARIGNEGIATSFYNEKNEEIAQDLVKNLIECKQIVPDFLEEFRPEGELVFDDDSDDEFFEQGSAAGTDAGAGSVSDEGRLDEVPETKEDAYSDAGSGKEAGSDEGKARDAAYDDRKTLDERDVDQKSRKKSGLVDSAYATSPAPEAQAPKQSDFWG